MVGGGEQQRQHRVTRLVVQVEPVAAVTDLVRHGQNVGEAGTLGERHGPLRTKQIQIKKLKELRMLHAENGS